MRSYHRDFFPADYLLRTNMDFVPSSSVDSAALSDRRQSSRARAKVDGFKCRPFEAAGSLLRFQQAGLDGKKRSLSKRHLLLPRPTPFVQARGGVQQRQAGLFSRRRPWKAKRACARAPESGIAASLTGNARVRPIIRAQNLIAAGPASCDSKMRHVGVPKRQGVISSKKNYRDVEVH